MPLTGASLHSPQLPNAEPCPFASFMDKCTHVTFRQRWKIYEMAPSHRWIWTVADNRRYMTYLVPYFKERYQACQARGYASAIILLRSPVCIAHMRVEQLPIVSFFDWAAGWAPVPYVRVAV
uniref:Uncharacterized protein n=1 Tax=Thermogemmatispora argillosa TaxID=2045280 RepID=A0A455T7U4_9CHLR|nr:hypothetical protein KTA_37110 [Thermogemmatispora argillosa]